MKTSPLLAAVVAASLAAATGASAQTIVFDPTNHAQILNEVQNGIKQLRAMQSQLQEAQRLYQAANSISGIGDIAQILNSSSVREHVPQDLKDVMKVVQGGTVDDLGELSRRIDVIKKTYGLEDAGSGTPGVGDADRYYRTALGTSGDRAARDMALGEGVYSSASDRLAGLQHLQRAVGTAETASQKMDLQNRIQAESAMIQNEVLRLQGLAMVQAAEDRLAEQQSRERAASRSEARQEAARRGHSWGN